MRKLETVPHPVRTETVFEERVRPRRAAVGEVNRFRRIVTLASAVADEADGEDGESGRAEFEGGAEVVEGTTAGARRGEAYFVAAASL